MNKEPDCIVHWTDASTSITQLRCFRPGLASVVGQAGGSPSECIMLIPSWAAFEQASQSRY